MKIIFTNFLFLIKKFKTSSILNILGLSVAFSVFMVVSIQVYYDATYNRNFEKADNIEFLYFHNYSDDRDIIAVSRPFAQQIADLVPEIKNYVAIRGTQSVLFDITTKDGLTKFYLKITETTEGFLDVFSPQIVAGDVTEIFVDPSKIMISETDAQKIFGTESAIGKTIQFHFSKKPLTIVAVYKDFPKNCFLVNGIYRLTDITDPQEWGFGMYMELEQGSHDMVLDKLNKSSLFGEEAQKHFEEHPEERREARATPIVDTYLLEGNNKASFISLIAVAILILIIACVNLLNLSVAMAPSRIRAINIHKILGISKSKLWMTILSESILLSLIALVLALFLMNFFSSTSLSSYFSADLSILKNLKLLIPFVLFLLLIIIIIGIYPARYITSFPETITLNGSFALSSRGSRLRNILITIQFIVVISLCSISYFLKIQHDYMRTYGTGMSKENILYLPLMGLKVSVDDIGNEMLKNPAILGYTASEALPGAVYMGWTRNFEEKDIFITSWPVNPNFLDFFGVKLIAGENFTDNRKDTSALEQVIVNKNFLDKYGFDNSIIGKYIYGFNDGVIKGVVADVNFRSLHYPIEPMAFVVLNGKYQEERLNYFFLKISAENVPSTINYIRDTWTKFSDEEFKLTFLDQKLDDLYKKEDNMTKLISLLAVLTIVIALMGIYGLILFNTRYKMKEIAIRKVNGANESEIVLLLNRGFLQSLSIAFVISIPLSYFAIEKWLENFAFKASIPWWLFPCAGLLVFLISALTISWQSWKTATSNPVNYLKNE